MKRDIWKSNVESVLITLLCLSSKWLARYFSSLQIYKLVSLSQCYLGIPILWIVESSSTVLTECSDIMPSKHQNLHKKCFPLSLCNHLLSRLFSLFCSQNFFRGISLYEKFIMSLTPGVPQFNKEDQKHQHNFTDYYRSDNLDTLELLED